MEIESNEKNEGLESWLANETKFFGINPMKFVEQITTAGEDKATELANKLEDDLMADPELRQHHEKEIEQGSEQLLEDFLKSFDKYFDLMELYMLRNIFQLPKGIETAMSSQATTDSPNEQQLLATNQKLDKEIEDLKENIMGLYSELVTAKYEAKFEIEETNKLETFSQHIDEFIDKKMNEHGVQSMEEATQSVVDQMIKMLGLMQTMKD